MESRIAAPSSRAATNVLASTTGTQRERLPVHIYEKPAHLSAEVARRIARMIKERQSNGERLVLGLPTGSTPIGVYQQLVWLHENEGLDFSNVVTFNLDEYFPMDPHSIQSYQRFMRENFFERLNIPPQNVHIPRGDIPREQVEEHSAAYERAIKNAGGLSFTEFLAAFNDQVLFLKHNLNAQAVASLEGELSRIRQDVDSLIREMERSIAASEAFLQRMQRVER